MDKRIAYGIVVASLAFLQACTGPTKSEPPKAAAPAAAPTAAPAAPASAMPPVARPEPIFLVTAAAPFLASPRSSITRRLRADHSARVASYALALAMEMGQTDKIQLQAMAAGCIFHDIGKSKIDLTILNKNGPLTNDEWTLIKKHPEFGEQLVHDGFLGVVPLEIILHHHERLDGGGYPHKLTAKDILMEVRIASFADTFDALTTNRTYQAGRSRYEALDLIRHRFLEQLDKDCYKAMVLILKRASEKA
jgi:HD-GYP domain-containing protein (c-di-GMP phosphodiesterase class II)